MDKYRDITSQVPAPLRPTERYLNRDLSWLKFNERVLDQVEKLEKTVFEQLDFLRIAAANLDEFFMVRIGRLYNSTDTHQSVKTEKQDIRTLPVLGSLLEIAKKSFQRHHAYFIKKVKPRCADSHFVFVQDIATLSSQQRDQVRRYFDETLLPILKPVASVAPTVLPVLMNKALILGVVTHQPEAEGNNKRTTFIQLPQNLSRFYKVTFDRYTCWIPIEKVVREYLPMLFGSLSILSVTLFRPIRNGDFLLEESDDVAQSLVEALQRKLKERSQGKIVRLEIEENYDPWLLDFLKHKWSIDPDNIFLVPEQSLVDLTGVQQIVQQSHVDHSLPVLPISYPIQYHGDLFQVLKKQDILLHHPYNSMDLVINFLEKAAEDPCVLAIKITIYRLAQDSAVTAALCKAAICGKRVLVLMEIRARFDEEYNMREAKRLEQAGCLVIYGRGCVKTHAKMMMIVRREEDRTIRYVHLSSGNYNEETAKRYADVSLMTTDVAYAHDVSVFFDTMTNHAKYETYHSLIIAPLSIRTQLTTLIHQEAKNARQGLSCGIVIKVNALEDKEIIEELYKASQAGVSIRLIVRGICCLVPQRPGLSANIKVCSIVGNFLEHARIFYFHNQGHPKVYAGSADIMVRSFDQRIEALFPVKDPMLKQQIINILVYDLKDNVNSYLMQEDGTYIKVIPNNEVPFDIHKAFFKLAPDAVIGTRLFT